MHAVIHHFINDPVKWEKGVQSIMSLMGQGKLPKGLKALEYLPSVDGRKADCVWEADSLDSLRQFIDHETSGAARNEYFEVNVDGAIGLPKGEEHLETQVA